MTESTRVLKIDEMTADEVFLAFDGLEPGGAAVLVSEGDPRPLLAAFQARRPGAFEWSVLEATPGRHRVEIRRRHSAAARTVTDYLEFDHRRLDAILPAVRHQLDAQDLRAAAEQFAEFSCGLNHHIDAEERILFPAFEERTGMRAGPTRVMRAEHVEIRHWMSQAGASLAAGDEAGARDALDRMAAVLLQHNMKEEQILYPLSDQATEADERDALVRQMQAL